MPWEEKNPREVIRGKEMNLMAKEFAVSLKKIALTLANFRSKEGIWKLTLFGRLEFVVILSISLLESKTFFFLFELSYFF